MRYCGWKNKATHDTYLELLANEAVFAYLTEERGTYNDDDASSFADEAIRRAVDALYVVSSSYRKQVDPFDLTTLDCDALAEELFDWGDDEPDPWDYLWDYADYLHDVRGN